MTTLKKVFMFSVVVLLASQAVCMEDGKEMEWDQGTIQFINNTPSEVSLVCFPNGAKEPCSLLKVLPNSSSQIYSSKSILYARIYPSRGEAWIEVMGLGVASSPGFNPEREVPHYGLGRWGLTESLESEFRLVKSKTKHVIMIFNKSGLIELFDHVKSDL